MCMKQLGIMAFGSLIEDPGQELGPTIVERIPVITPFAVEFAKYSSTRGGAPTLAPVRHGGQPVNAMVFVLDAGVSQVSAVDMLWRRETRNVGTGKRYPAKHSPKAVRVRKLVDFEGVACVLYTDFYARGKLLKPKAAALARRAVRSVQLAARGKDGISYLMQAMSVGISTPLMKAYQNEILRITGSDSLSSALEKVRIH